MSLILSGTDGLSDVDGTAATPAIRGTDANTGIFFGTDIIAFAEGGAECARFDSSGNFGVGTSSPSGRLHAVTTTNTAVNGAADAGYSLFRGTTNSSGGVLSVSGNSTGNGINYTVFNSTLTGYEPANYGASQHIWKLGATEALRLNSSANLVLQGGTTTANGIGITFPATQSASSDANTLDDYEEGTWTPSVGGTATYNSQSASYTKVGRLVTVNFNLQVNTLGTGSAQFISGLPFAASLSDYQGGSITVAQSLALNFYMITIATGGGSSTQIGFGLQTTLDASTTTPDQSVIASGCRLTGTITYFV